MVCGMELRHFLEKLEVSGSFFVSLCFRACLKKAFCKMCVTLCRRLRNNSTNRLRKSVKKIPHMRLLNHRDLRGSDATPG